MENFVKRCRITKKILSIRGAKYADIVAYDQIKQFSGSVHIENTMKLKIYFV